MFVSFLVRENLLAVGEDVEGAGAAHLDLDGDVEFTFDVLFQAHGLSFQILSEEAAFDGDFHASLTFPAAESPALL
jgi:hypothetical protein